MRSPLRFLPGPRRTFAGLLVLASFALALVAACTRTKSIDFLITVPTNLSAETVWIEVSVYENVQCNLAGRVSYGEAPMAGPVRRILFSPADKSVPVPELGDLPNGFYSFVAQVKNANCEVIARGCDGENVGDVGTIRINTKPDLIKGPPCDSSMVCRLAQCVPKRSGQNCSLDVVGSGPLFESDQLTGLVGITAPAARAVPNGFLLAYGQYDLDLGTQTLLQAQPIARNGGQPPGFNTAFPNRCSAVPQLDGTGLGWSNAEQTGVVAFARNECGNEGLGTTGIDLMMLGADGASKQRTGLLSVTGTPKGEVLLAQNHAVVSLGGGRWGVAASVAGQAEALFFQETTTPGGGAGFEDIPGDTGADRARIQFGMPGGRHIAASMAASATSIALVAVNEFDEEPPDEDDAGTEPDPDLDGGGGDAGDAGGDGMGIRQGEIQTGVRKFSVQFVSADKIGSKPTLPPPFDMNSTFASVAIVDNRAFVVGDGPSGRQDPTLYAINFDPNGNPGAELSSEDTAILTNGEGQGSQVDYADIAVADDRVFIATAIPGDIILSVFAQASTQPSPLRTLRLSQVRASTVSSIRDGRVSIAVGNNRVLVVWATATELRPNDPVGGYAIFACEP